MKRILLIITALALLTINGVAIAASDISSAVYYGIIRATNAGTTASDICVPVSINSTANIAAGIFTPTINNTAILNSTGVDTYFMPGYANNPWVVWYSSIPAGNNKDSTLYTGATGGYDRYFPSAAGMVVSDNASLEPGSYYSVSVVASANTTVGDGKYLFDKSTSLTSQVFRMTTSNTTAGDIEFCTQLWSDNFTSDAWSDQGTKILVDTGDGRLEFESERSATDTRTYIAASGISDSTWKLSFTLNLTSYTAFGKFVFGLWSDAANLNGYANDAILLLVNEDDCSIESLDGGNDTYSDVITINTATTYYFTLERTSITNARLSIFSDAARATHIEDSPVNFTIPATVVSLDVIQGSNLNDNASADQEEIGWIDDLGVNQYILTAHNVDNTEQAFNVALTSGNCTLSVANVVQDWTSVITGIPDTAADWQFCKGGGVNFMNYAFVSTSNTTKGYWEWEYNPVFYDGSGNGNTATPNFRTVSSNPDVSATLYSFNPVSLSTADEQYVLNWGSMIDDAPEEPETSFSETARPGFFFEPLVHTLWGLTDLPDSFFWYNFAFFIIIGAGMVAYYAFAKNNQQALLLKCVVMGAFMILFATEGINIYGWYVCLYFIIFCFGVMVMSKSYGW